MKKWLNNWELKQEYLVNLRREFTADSNAFLNKIEDIHRKIDGRQDLVEEFSTIKDLFHKIEVNYMMGNSFYWSRIIWAYFNHLFSKTIILSKRLKKENTILDNYCKKRVYFDFEESTFDSLNFGEIWNS